MMQLRIRMMFREMQKFSKDGADLRGIGRRNSAHNGTRRDSTVLRLTRGKARTAHIRWLLTGPVRSRGGWVAPVIWFVCWSLQSISRGRVTVLAGGRNKSALSALALVSALRKHQRGFSGEELRKLRRRVHLLEDRMTSSSSLKSPASAEAHQDGRGSDASLTARSRVGSSHGFNLLQSQKPWENRLAPRTVGSMDRSWRLSNGEADRPFTTTANPT